MAGRDGVAVPPNGLAIERMSPDDLLFDEDNPRLQGRGEGTPQEEILRTLWREYAVDEIALSIAANGYFEYEPMLVTEEKARLVVVEGNRRLAAVKILLDARLRSVVRAVDLPELTDQAAERLHSLPVVRCLRSEIWRYVGFKHVNGPKQWDAMAKAEYIAWVRGNLQIELEDIARQIGDRHATVARLYNGLMALRQAEKRGVWDRERRYHKRFFFSHLYTGLGYDGFQKFLDIRSTRASTSEQPIPQGKLDEFGEVCLWLFGDRDTNTPPLVQSQNPDLRRLDEVLQSPHGVDALRRGLTLSVSLEIARGDERILRENLVVAKSALQTVKARLVTGYQGEEEVRQNAEDIFSIAESVLDEMDYLDRKRMEPADTRRRRPRSGR